MRTIENKTLNIKRVLIEQNVAEKTAVVVEEKSETTYFKMLFDLCSAPPKQGWNLENLKSLTTRMSLIAKLESGKQKIQIEENEYDSLKTALSDTSMLFTSMDALKFLQYLSDLPKAADKK